MISSDGSFTPPVISDPALVLRASYGDGHEVLLDWEWAYQVGESHFRAGLHQSPGDAGYRDLAAEQALLDRLRLGGIPEDMVASCPARRPGHRALHHRAAAVADRPARGERRGHRGRRRLPGGQRFAAHRRLHGRDSGRQRLVRPRGHDPAEGRAIPFADVFAALTAGQSHLLLPDGAYFSLDKPELRRLAQLIRRPGSCRTFPAAR